MTLMNLTLLRQTTIVGLLLAACGPDSNTTATTTGDTTTETTGDTSSDSGATTTPTSEASSGPPPTTSEPGTSSGSTTAEPPPGCECIVDDPGDAWVDPSLPSCAAPICATVVASLADEGSDTPDEVDLAALECALTALRDRTPGLLRWEIERSENPNLDSGYVWIQDDGRAIWRKWEAEDLVFTVWAAQLLDLPASEVYAQCLAEPDAAARVACLGQSLADPANLVCDEGWSARGI